MFTYFVFLTMSETIKIATVNCQGLSCPCEKQKAIQLYIYMTHI